MTFIAVLVSERMSGYMRSFLSLSIEGGLDTHCVRAAERCG